MQSDSSPPDSGFTSLLRHPNYMLFWASRMLTVLAVQAQGVTIAWQVYAVARQHGDVRQAAFAVGMIGLAQFAPLFALALNAGEAADRHDRRLISATCMGIEVATSSALMIMALVGLKAIWPVYVVAVVFGAGRAFLNPANASLGPMLVPIELLPRALAWNSLATRAGQIVGPALGGLLLLISPAASFGTCAVLYLLGIAAVMAIRAVTKPEPQFGSRWALVKEGLAYVWTSKIVLGAISLDLFAVLLGGATALLPVYARDILKVGPEGFGLLRAGPAIGALVVSVVLAARPISRKAGLFMFTGVTLFGLSTLVFALSTSLAISVGAMIVLGGADMLSVYIRQTLVQIVTPGAMRGRVAAVSGLFIGASNELGQFESGVTARLFGPIGAAVFGGVGALIVTGVWASIFPALRKADRLA